MNNNNYYEDEMSVPDRTSILAIHMHKFNRYVNTYLLHSVFLVQVSWLGDGIDGYSDVEFITVGLFKNIQDCVLNDAFHKAAKLR